MLIAPSKVQLQERLYAHLNVLMKQRYYHCLCLSSVFLEKKTWKIKAELKK